MRDDTRTPWTINTPTAVWFVNSPKNWIRPWKQIRSSEKAGNLVDIENGVRYDADHPVF
jgi:hypothetical protein